MDQKFDGYQEDLNRVRLTQDSKAALIRALAEYESGVKAAGKRSGKRVRMVLVTAAVALGALVLMAAALPGFWSMLGVHLSVRDNGDGQIYGYSHFGGEKCPIEVAEGRVWFTFDGQHIDITGQFDDEHAYVYEMTNPETGQPNYILVGWSAGGIGYGEIVLMPENGGESDCAFAAHTLGVVWVDPDYPVFDHTFEPVEGHNDWFGNAVEEICAPYLEKIRPQEGTYETQPPRTRPESSDPPAEETVEPDR